MGGEGHITEATVTESSLERRLGPRPAAPGGWHVPQQTGGFALRWREAGQPRGDPGGDLGGDTFQRAKEGSEPIEAAAGCPSPTWDGG